MSSVIFAENSANKKLSSGKEKIASTYLPIKQTCSDDCSLKNKVCYAQTGFVGLHNWRMEKSAKGKPHDKLLKMEANKIRRAAQKRKIDNVPLRLHVSGDCKTVKGASYLKSAARFWSKMGGGLVYTYTHSWRRLKRQAWGSISVLASVENPEQTRQAKKQGYASAIVVESFPSTKAFELDGEKFIPCPNQTFGVSCVKCKLCFKADSLFARNINIAFSAHGSRKNKLIQIHKKERKENLNQIE